MKELEDAGWRASDNKAGDEINDIDIKTLLAKADEDRMTGSGCQTIREY